jgi:hypothetical protein
MPSVASYWLPEGVNPPCSCERHDHRNDDEAGRCEYSTTNDPASWGICACQHMANKPITMEKYERWQADIQAGRIGPDDIPSRLGISY